MSNPAIIDMQTYITKTSRLIHDTYPDDLCEEARHRRKLDKIGEELGEVFDSYSGMVGENPRKGVSHTLDDVLDELLDVAATALGAYEQLTGWRGIAILDMAANVARKYQRLVTALEVPA